MIRKYTITMYKYISMVFEITKKLYFFENYDALGMQDDYAKNYAKGLVKQNE